MKIALFFLLLGSFSCQAASAQGTPPGSDSQKGYQIGPSDEITGKVLGEPQFDFVSTVDEDGKIEVPFFDKPVVAMCKTERDLRIEVAQLLAKYLKSPQLSLRVTQRNSRPPVSVLGEVLKEQQYSLTRRVKLLEVLSAVGGPTDKNGGIVRIFRTKPPICADPSTVAQWKADSNSDLGVPSQTYTLANVRQGITESNPEIFPGDIIVVPKANPVYVVGEVVHPGELSIPEGGLPLSQAMAMASGITRQAKTSSIKIYRRKAGSPQPEAMSVNYDNVRKGREKDIMLEPFDIIEVGKAPKKITDYLIEFAVGLPNRIPLSPL